MANLIKVSVLRYGDREYGTTLADAKTMVLSTEHIIYGTNVEVPLGINATAATAATDAVTITAHGLTSGEYIRVGDIGDSVGNFDIASSDYSPGQIYRQKITGANNVFLHGNETLYDADTKMDITTGATGLALPVYRVQGEIIYADTQNGGRPIKIRTSEICTGQSADTTFGVPVKSGQLMVLDCEKKNGITFSKPSDEYYSRDLMINHDRVILAYEDANSSDDFIVWYDASNTNKAGMDSSHVDILQVDENFADSNERFVNHLGGKSTLDGLKSL